LILFWTFAHYCLYLCTEILVTAFSWNWSLRKVVFQHSSTKLDEWKVSWTKQHLEALHSSSEIWTLEYLRIKVITPKCILIKNWALFLLNSLIVVGCCWELKKNSRFSPCAFFRDYMNKLWIFKVLKIDVPITNPRLLWIEVAHFMQGFVGVDLRKGSHLGLVSLINISSKIKNNFLPIKLVQLR